jgi:hypothetical protein
MQGCAFKKATGCHTINNPQSSIEYSIKCKMILVWHLGKLWFYLYLNRWIFIVPCPIIYVVTYRLFQGERGNVDFYIKGIGVGQRHLVYNYFLYLLNSSISISINFNN